jgi:2-methylcitrate dehydratase
MPADYDSDALCHPLTLSWIPRIQVRHGGPEYDALYPDGIPTSVEMDHEQLGWLRSGLVKYPLGHSRCPSGDLHRALESKIRRLLELGVEDVAGFLQKCSRLTDKTSEEIAELYTFSLKAEN